MSFGRPFVMAPEVPKERIAILRKAFMATMQDPALQSDAAKARLDVAPLSGEERPFPLDLVPRVIPASEWATIEAGVTQRVRALEAFLSDLYDGAQILDDGVVPRRLVTTSAHFRREAYGIEPANGVLIHVSGVDLVRAQASECAPSVGTEWTIYALP